MFGASPASAGLCTDALFGFSNYCICVICPCIVWPAVCTDVFFEFLYDADIYRAGVPARTSAEIAPLGISKASKGGWRSEPFLVGVVRDDEPLVLLY